MAKKNPYLGSTLESLLREDGTYEDAKNQTIKSVLAYKLEQFPRWCSGQAAGMVSGAEPVARRIYARIFAGPAGASGGGSGGGPPDR